MKAEELRIGNIIKFSESDEIFLAYEIMPSGFRVRNKNEDTWIEEWQFEGIEITQDWLVKFGFLKMNSTWWTCYKNTNFRMSISFDLELSGNWTGIRIKYVHQLQNLFYALTGEELSLSGI